MTGDKPKGSRAIALVGPYHSGKTSLLESILSITGSVHRKGEGIRVFGDSSAEAKEREMGVEANFGHTKFMEDDYYFIDCPGSLEFLQESLSVLKVVDAAIIVVEPDESKIASLAPLLNSLQEQNIPRIVFINKVDHATGSVRNFVSRLNEISKAPIVLRELPLREGEEVVGYVDLASKRAYHYGKQEASKRIDLPEGETDRVAQARYEMLETLSDFDDALMEQLLEDIDPDKADVFSDLAKDMADGLIVPALMGSAIQDNGTFRLLKLLRHEAPGIENTQARLNIGEGGALGLVVKTLNTAHGGKRSLVRVLRGSFKDGETANGERISGMTAMQGDEGEKRTTAETGDLLAFGRMEKVKTGDVLTTNGSADGDLSLPVLPPVYALAIEIENRNDEVKLATSLVKIVEEDISITFAQHDDTHEMVMEGQGEIHLKVAIDRLKSRYGLGVKSRKPRIPYQETIRKKITHHARYKKQSGGHGQFGDVVVEIEPLSRGEGFRFEQRIHGGSVPRQYIPSVENGVKAYLKKGPLGFPVVDLLVVLIDGKYHAVDSSDMAFQTAGRMAMSEGLPECRSVLLEPVMKVKIFAPSEYNAKLNSLVSTRRGQLLGFDTRAGWSGWDAVEAMMPQAEMADMILELRSVTAGTGTYEFEYDHMAELSGRDADQVIEARKEELAG